MSGKVFLTASVGILVGAGVSSYVFTQSLAKEYKHLISSTKTQTQEVQAENAIVQNPVSEQPKTETQEQPAVVAETQPAPAAQPVVEQPAAAQPVVEQPAAAAQPVVEQPAAQPKVETVANPAPVDNTPKTETVEVQQLTASQTPVVNNQASVTEQQAKQTMANKVPGGTFRSFHYDREDNTYEGEIIKGNYEYEIEVSARTGKIIKCEKEFRDRFDD